jgi:16S rRNA (uracil1498-N3)-methyltransferase
VNARFHAPDARPGERVVLGDEEARHLTRVLRLDVGAVVAVFDGRGGEFLAVVETVGKHLVELRVGVPKPAAAEPRIAVTLLQAVLKGDKMDDVVRDAAMIGVAAILPVVAGRSEVSLATLLRARRRERWERIAVSAVKQCGRAVVPPVLTPVEFATVMRADDSLPVPAPGIMLVEPAASPAATPLGELHSVPSSTASLLIGPEGGWTPDEVAAAAASWRLVTMGGRTLRADAMATIAVAALFTKWGEY